MDITERKRAEEALKESEEHFRKFIENAIVGVCLVGLDGKFINVNDSMCELLGYSEKELQKFTFNDITFSEDKETSSSFVARMVSGEINKFSFEKRYVHKDGHLVWGIVSSSLIRDSKGSPKYFITHVHDITERKRSEEILTLFSHTIKSINECISITDLDNNILFVNQAFLDTYGYSQEELIGKSIYIVRTDPEIITDVVLNDTIQGGWKGELLNRKKDGSVFPIYLSTSVVYDEKRKPIALVGAAIDITERKQAEIALNESKVKYQAIFEATGTSTLIVEEDTSISMANDECLNVTGYKPDELIGQKWTSFVVPDSLKEMLYYHNLRRNDPGRAPKKYEVKLVNKKGEVRNAILDIGMIPSIKQSIVSILDITEWKRAEKELRESEERYHRFVDSITDYIYSVKLESGRPVETIHGPGCISVTGYTSEEFADDQYLWYRMVYDEDKQKVEDLITNIVSGKAIEPIEHRIVHKDGSIRWIKNTPVLQYNNERMLISFEGLISDITERKLAEAALRESEERFRNLYENAPIGIYRTTPDGRILLSNQQLLDMLGFNSFEELKNRNLNEEGFQPAYSRDIFKTLMAKNGEVIGLESAWYKKDGSIIFVRENAKAIKDQDGTIIYYDGMVEDITERKKAEEAVKQGEERMRAIVEGTPHLFFYMQDVEANTTYVSPTVEQITGYKPDIWRKRKDWFITNAKINQKARTKTHAHLGGENAGEPVLLEVRHANGNPILLEAYEYPIIQDNKVIGLQGVAHDITERINAEGALRESEKKYKSVIENIQDVFYRSDKYGRLIMGSPSGARMFGYSSVEEMITLSLDSFWLNSSERKLVLSIMREKGMVNDYEATFVKKDGTIFPASLSAHFYYDENGKIQGTEGIIRDITERKRAEEALRESENTLRVFINAIPEASLLVDTNGNIVVANQALAKGFGENTETIVDKNFYRLLPSKIAKFRKAKIKESIKQNRPVSFEDFHTGHYYYNYLNPILDESNKVSKIAIIGFDITERKNTELELEKYRLHLEELIKERTRELEEVNLLLQDEIIKQREAEEKVRLALQKEKELSELKSKFISIASHEFRTPLTTVLSSTELLERYGRTWDQDKYIKQTDRIRKSVKYLTNLMDEVLIISRADTGKIKFEPKKVDLEKLCNNILEDIKLIISSKHNIEFEINISQKSFMLDEKLLKFIILNLLSNAIKYSPKGGKIGFKVTELDGLLKIKVSDKGIGIPEEDRIHLFDPFNRGSNVGDIHGTGLGMSIVKRSVDMYNGLIEYDSKVGAGTTFIVSLPINAEC